MEKVELFEKINNTIEKAFTNMKQNEELKAIYEKNNYGSLENDISELKKDIDIELKDCFKNIKEKERRKYNISEGIYVNNDNNRHDIFVIIPIFNTTDEQAEECIYSVIDNYIGLDYKLLIMSNRILKVFDIIKDKIPTYIYLKSKFSLPEAYNLMVGHAKEYSINDDNIISLMDDDAYILTGQTEKVKECYTRIKKDEYIASSGHYYDITPCATEFEKMINQTHIQSFVSKYRKPYCHGGASFMIKIKNFPHNGLPITGLGGISINILAIEKNKDKDRWFLYNDTDFVVYHPRKKNIFAWITTYLSYEIAWNRALNMLSKEDLNTWRKKLDHDSKNRALGLQCNLKNKAQRKYALGNIYLTQFLKPLLKENLNYEEFKKYNVAVHGNLKQ